MEKKKLQKTEIQDGVQLYRTNFADIGFKVDEPHHMKRGSEVIQITKKSDEEIIVGVTVHKTPEDFTKWLDYHKD